MMNTSRDNLSCSPPKRLAEAVKNEGRKTEGPSGTLDVYTLPLEPQMVEGCKCFMFGKASGKMNRTIMVLGATGAGKSTLVNRMINYILGVTWEDTFRFKLVDDGTAKSQAHSQTSEVTVYKLNHREGFKFDYSLTIVDTPGFGDTRGIESDRVILTQLKKVFSAKHGVKEIDAICVVAKASLNRLTQTQKYIFDAVLKIFGKNVAENIRILVTFSDGTPPAVLNAIIEAGIPCPKLKNGLPIHFIFNNADKMIPDANNEDEDDDENEEVDPFKSLWNKGTKSMSRFFSALNDIETKSLSLTKEVLKQRYQMEISIANIQSKMKSSWAKFDEIEKKSKILYRHNSDKTANENFEFESDEQRIVKFKTDEKNLNCENCKSTCHRYCDPPLHAPYFCKVFINHCFSARCTQCKDKCPVPNHSRDNFYWGFEMVKVKQTSMELKAKYQKASEEAISVEDVIKRMKEECKCIEDEVVKLIEQSVECQNTLNEIALNPSPLSTSEYMTC
ncbi:uncharacterized protein LOC132462555 [Gadus macrocephalus]|uniref:uncharacterized protein LOC132462555 n=1 Tax=Gadus macrocephalus TaxID=80720 RepID=UPI0028CB5BD9|nr:uncharacterized protein LOC132462555 [Gadus macrocephalus]